MENNNNESVQSNTETFINDSTNYPGTNYPGTNYPYRGGTNSPVTIPTILNDSVGLPITTIRPSTWELYDIRDMFSNKFMGDILDYYKKCDCYILGDLSSIGVTILNNFKTPIDIVINDHIKGAYVCVTPNTPLREFNINESKCPMVYVWAFSNYIPEYGVQLDLFNWDYFIDAFPKKSDKIIKLTHYISNNEMSHIFYDKLISIDFLGKISEYMENIFYLDLDWGYLIDKKYEPAYTWVIYYLNRGSDWSEPIKLQYSDVNWGVFNGLKNLLYDQSYFIEMLDLKNLQNFKNIINFDDVSDIKDI